MAGAGASAPFLPTAGPLKQALLEYLLTTAGRKSQGADRPLDEALRARLLEPHVTPETLLALLVHRCGVIDGKPRPEFVIAVARSRVASLPREEARTLMLSTPALAERVTMRLAERLRTVSAQRTLLGVPNPAQRVCAQLIQLSVKVADGKVVIAHAPTHQEIAIMVNTSRETVTRVFQVLQARGILLEDEDRFAERQGWTKLEEPAVDRARYDAESLALLEVFEYFIGNTDWSVAAASHGEDTCCHNVVPYARSDGTLVPVPYDFDSSGIVNPPYAAPDERLRLRDVRQRLYRGRCRSPEELAPIFARFEAQKPAIVALFDESQGLDAGVATRARAYISQIVEVSLPWPRDQIGTRELPHYLECRRRVLEDISSSRPRIEHAPAAASGG